ncbi:unnamed protein product [Urochloa humidicola]
MCISPIPPQLDDGVEQLFPHWHPPAQIHSGAVPSHDDPTAALRLPGGHSRASSPCAVVLSPGCSAGDEVLPPGSKAPAGSQATPRPSLSAGAPQPPCSCGRSSPSPCPCGSSLLVKYGSSLNTCRQGLVQGAWFLG